jgi:multimeric flavodoxin WrbA
MKAILLDGSKSNDSTGERVRATLTEQLETQGWEVEHFALCEKKIGNCAGDFFCWIRTPGVCNVNDDNRAIAEALVASDLMVYLTPLTFGGYSAALKSMVDHQIQNVSPFFARVKGETHHRKRYKNNPDLLVVGWMEAPDSHSEAVFRHLVQRIALNWHSKTWVGDVILTNQSDEELQASAGQWVDDIQNRKSSTLVELPTNGDPSTAASASSVGGIGTIKGHREVKIKRALLLVGSPKTRKSTSNSLGGYLFEQLEARSIKTETIYLHTVLRNVRKMQALQDAVEAADLVTLAFPLYCDSLPAPVIEALERIAAHRQGHDPSHRQLFTAIANCGFPEAYQCDTALAICEIFARQAGFAWAGAMALGGGGMVNGFPLAEGGGKTIYMRQSLELAAQGLVEGSAIPNAARVGLAKPIIPHWMYWLVSFQRFILDAKGYGALKSIMRKPYLVNVK